MTDAQTLKAYIGDDSIEPQKALEVASAVLEATADWLEENEADATSSIKVLRGALEVLPATVEEMED